MPSLISSIGTLVPAVFETGGQFGLSLGTSIIAGIPFQSTQVKVLAAGIGGGIPALWKTCFQSLGTNDIQGRQKARTDAIINALEVGAGFAANFIPSWKKIFVVNGLLAVGFESIRQRELYGKKWREALFSGGMSGLLTMALGGLALHHSQTHWARAFTKARGFATAQLDWKHQKQAEKKLLQLLHEAQRETTRPTLSWYLHRRRALLNSLHQDAEQVFRLTSKERLEEADVHTLAGLAERLATHKTDLNTVHLLGTDYAGGPLRKDRHTLYLHAMVHELGSDVNSIAIPVNTARSLSGEGESVVTILMELQSLEGLRSAAQNLQHTVAFYRDEPNLGRAFEMIRRQFGRRGTIDIGPVNLSLSRKEQFDAGIILREWHRNPSRIAVRNNQQNAHIMTRQEGQTLSVTDNVGGFAPSPRERALMGGDSGRGMELVEELAALNGWDVRRIDLEGGTKMILSFG